MKIVHVDELPSDPIEAAGVFHRHWVKRVETALHHGDDVLIALEPADHRHRDWRRAMARDFARAFAPRRVNIVAYDGEATLSAFSNYLRKAPGITGQYFEGDGHGAGNPAG